MQNRSRHFSRQQFVPMSGLQKLTLKKGIFKSPNSSKSENFDLLILIFKVPNFMRIIICDNHSCSVLRSLDMQFNKHAGRCYMGVSVGECRSPTYFRGRTLFPLFVMLPLSFNSNYDDITVLKQSANRAIILAKILSYSPRARFPHF